MAKADNQFQRMAADAAERLDRARAAGEQLDRLPREPDAGALVAPERAGRGRGKAVSQFREWLAHRGHRLPEEVLAEMAGLASGSDAFLTAMARAEQLMHWAGAHLTPKGKIDLFLQIFAAQLRAADALLPYGLAKVQPDAAPPPPVQVNVFGGQASSAPADRASGARDVTPRASRSAPPPMPAQIVENQGLGDVAAPISDAGSRTQDASD